MPSKRWMDCSGCEGTGKVDASDPVRTSEPDMVTCADCEGDGEQRCGYHCNNVADCLAVYRTSRGGVLELREEWLCWECFDELAAEGKIVALIEWRDEPARVMDDKVKHARLACWTFSRQGASDIYVAGERGRGDMAVSVVAPQPIVLSVRDAYKLAALLMRAGRFAAQERQEKEEIVQPAI